jgi:WD40 repeat protein
MRLLGPGTTWQEFNQGLPYQDVRRLARNLSDPNYLYALTNSSGLYFTDIRTSNGWQPAGFSPEAAMVTPAYAPDHPFATREDLEADTHSPPPGMEKDALQLAGTSATITAMDFSPASGWGYIAFLTMNNSQGARVYRTKYSVWEPIGLDGFSADALALSPVNVDHVYVASSASNEIFFSLNAYNGTPALWNPTSIAGITSVYALAYSQDGNYVYAGTNSGVFIKSSIGGSWVPRGLGGYAVTAIAVDPARPNRIFAGTTQGVFISADGGSIWNTADPELTGKTIQSIAFDPVNSSLVYFGTKESGIVWTKFP